MPIETLYPGEKNQTYTRHCLLTCRRRVVVFGNLGPHGIEARAAVPIPARASITQARRYSAGFTRLAPVARGRQMRLVLSSEEDAVSERNVVGLL